MIVMNGLSSTKIYVQSATHPILAGLIEVERRPTHLGSCSVQIEGALPLDFCAATIRRAAIMIPRSISPFSNRFFGAATALLLAACGGGTTQAEETASSVPYSVSEAGRFNEPWAMAFLPDGSLVLTTGGTGPALRDVTPEATLAIADKEMPGFGEQMRQISLRFVPTAILSRQVAVVRGSSLIINLPGQPKSITETLGGLKDAQGLSLVDGIFAAVPYCIDLIGGPYLETHDAVCTAFRPKSAQRLRPTPG